MISFYLDRRFENTVNYRNHFQGPNIALNKPTSQGPGTLSEASSDRAVDGRAQTRYNECAYSVSTVEEFNSCWWTVDLLDSYIITGISVHIIDKICKLNVLNGRLFRCK